VATFVDNKIIERIGNMKKRISILLIAVILVSMFSISAAALTPTNSQPIGTISRAAAASSWYFYVDGTGYTVPSGTLVGYNYTTTGQYVGTAQRVLNKINSKYLNAAIKPNCSAGTVDSIFGPNTWTAAYNFQVWVNKLVPSNERIATDGIIGNDTWTFLNTYLTYI